MATKFLRNAQSSQDGMSTEKKFFVGSMMKFLGLYFYWTNEILSSLILISGIPLIFIVQVIDGFLIYSLALVPQCI